MGKVRCFRDDSEIGPLLDRIPERERSTVIRMALRQYFFQSATVAPVMAPLEIPPEEPGEIDISFDEWK